MEDKDIKEMVCKLFDLTLEIESKEKEIQDYEEAHKTFAPLGMLTERISKTHEMYLICKEYLYR
jgi:uncharacterized protein YllA (UPF0747 family)